jgi:HSP20 family protein
MDRWLDQTASRSWGDQGVDTIADFTPPVDICETAETMEFFVELPGFKKDQIEIRVEQGNLILGGERKPVEKQETFHRVERAYGKFQRVFSLPSSIAPEGITAALKNGVLQITLPKSEAAKPRQIRVSVN